MFENPRRGRQAKNSTKNVSKILALKSSSEQIFSPKTDVWVPLITLSLQENAASRLEKCSWLYHSLQKDCKRRVGQRAEPVLQWSGFEFRKAWKNSGFSTLILHPIVQMYEIKVWLCSRRMKISSETRSFQMQIEFPNSCDVLQSRPVGGGGGGAMGAVPPAPHTHTTTQPNGPQKSTFCWSTISNNVN